MPGVSEIVKKIFCCMLILCSGIPAIVERIPGNSHLLSAQELSSSFGLQCGNCTFENNTTKCANPYGSANSSCSMEGCTDTNSCGIGTKYTGATIVVVNIDTEADPEDYDKVTSTSHLCYYRIICDEGEWDTTENCNMGSAGDPIKIGSCIAAGGSIPTGCMPCKTGIRDLNNPQETSESDQTCMDCPF